MRGAAILRGVSIAALAAGLCVVAGGCGGSDPKGGRVAGRLLTVYASAPLQGVARAAGRDTVRGEQLALAEAGSRVGRHAVRLVVLDAGAPNRERWAPAVVADNARRASRDPTTIGYLGELDTGGSTVSLPILNQNGILQVSPTDSFAGPTENEGAAVGEPAKYFPNPRVRRSFGRVAPDDDEQASVLAQWMRQEGAGRLTVVRDASLFGASLAREAATRADRLGIRTSDEVVFDPATSPARSVAAQVAAERPEAILVAVSAVSPAPHLWTALHQAVPQARLYAPGAMLLSAFTKHLPPGPEGATRLTGPPVSNDRAFAHAFASRFGRPPGPSAAYGYEAMRLVLDAIRRAGNEGGTRGAVVRRFFESRRRESALGPYAIRPDGSSTLGGFRRYRLRRGRLERAR